MIEGFSSMHMCVTCANRGITGQKTVSQPPQLELQMALVCHVGARDQTWFYEDLTNAKEADVIV